MTSARTRPVEIPIVDLNRAFQRRVAEQRAYGAAAAGLVADLERAGLHVSRLRELKRPTEGRKSATPILLHWFSTVSVESLRCDIADVLGSAWAQPEGGAALVAEYWNITAEPAQSPGRLIAAICTSLERVADDHLFDDLAAIAVDPTHGALRGMAVVGLGSAVEERDRAVELLLSLLDDDDVVLFALLGLMKLDARDEAARRVAFLTGHRNPIVRKTARRAVRRWREATPQPHSGPGW